MTELCAVSHATGRVLEIPGQPWTIEPPAEVRALRHQVHREMRAVDEMLRAAGLAAQILPEPETPAGALCALGGVAYC